MAENPVFREYLLHWSGGWLTLWQNVPMAVSHTDALGSRSRVGRKPLWASLLLLLLIGACWLALNVIRVHTYNYAADYQRHLRDFRQSLYWNVVEVQGFLVWAAMLNLVVSFGLAGNLLIRKLRSISH